jgi:hypothetical protein
MLSLCKNSSASTICEVNFALVSIKMICVRHLICLAKRQSKGSVIFNKNQTKGFAVKLLAIVLILFVQLIGVISFAHVGVVIYESTGVGKRENDVGHLALVATDLCSNNLRQVRACENGEPRGVVVSRYANLIVGQDIDWMAIPMTDHFLGTDHFLNTPLLVSGAITRMDYIEYWKNHSEALPLLTDETLALAKKKSEKITMGRIVNHYGLGLPVAAATIGQTKNPEAAFVIRTEIDGKELMIPGGRWSELIGVRQRRDSTMFLIDTKPEEEIRLLNNLMKDPNNKSHFQAFENNCSSFVKSQLKVAFPEIQFPSKALDPADLFSVTTPLSIVKGLVGLAKKEHRGYYAIYAPQFAGTRELSTTAKTIAMGTLVPDLNQSRTAFTIKTAITQLNPLITISARAANTLSRPVNVNKEIHESSVVTPRGIAQASNLVGVPADEDMIPNHIDFFVKDPNAKKTSIDREQFREFGTQQCWNQKRADYKLFLSQAKERQFFNIQELSTLNKDGRGKAYPQLLEKEGLTSAVTDGGHVAKLQGQVSGLTRGNILNYNMTSEYSPALALKIMTGVVNYDLVGEAENKRSSREFDADWALFVNVAKDNGFKLGANSQNVAECSAGDTKSHSDIKGDALSFQRQIRGLMLVPLKIIGVNYSN